MDPSAFESSHVHSVYNAIASDFSRTRHSRWPFVQHFLESLPPASLVLDAGTGNGKYLGVKSLLEWEGKHEQPSTVDSNRNPATSTSSDSPVAKNEQVTIGFDMSQGLLGIASGKGHEVVRGDCVDMSCWRRGAFDHAISIATIHHFATPERRMESIKQMILSILSPVPPRSNVANRPLSPGRILIVVWSHEQDPALLGARSARRTTGGKKGAVEINVASLTLTSNSDQRDQDDHDDDDESKEMVMETNKNGKDVFVPWERQKPVQPRQKKEPTPRRKKPGEPVIEPVVAAATTPLPPPPREPVLSKQEEEGEQKTNPTFNRYYHLFVHYELSRLVQLAAKSLHIKFEYPETYPLEPIDDDDDCSSTTTAGNKDELGWEQYVRLQEERWERENWVVEIQVGWRRTSATSA
ncbi:tRNA (carboxymethyluridine(34)-5-O)-methyltransferase [Sporobolomyces koalae]|uniref:tRNA (carboxymethyluridine(34)-5-O)-methyltransferase n=1 Tax=Sporobolomyces koalae TaxID=500713 RepID=UPI00317AFCB1